MRIHTSVATQLQMVLLILKFLLTSLHINIKYFASMYIHAHTCTYMHMYIHAHTYESPFVSPCECAIICDCSCKVELF